MLIRLLAWWLAAALLCLAVTTGIARHQSADAAERLVEVAVRIVAADWAHAFNRVLEPNRALDSLPGLSELIAPLLDPGLGIVAVGIALPSGQLVAARGVGSSPEAIAVRFSPEPEADADGEVRPPASVPINPTTRVLAVPLHDWTGSTRGTLKLAYRAGAAAPRGWLRAPWRIQEFGMALGTLAGLLALLGRSRWRSLSAADLQWIPAVAIAILITVSGATLTLGTMQEEDGLARRIVAGLGSRLAAPPVPWSASLMPASPIAPDRRLRRLANAAADLTGAGTGGEAPRLTFAQVGRQHPTVALRDDVARANLWLLLLGQVLVGLIASLAMAACLPAMLAMGPAAGARPARDPLGSGPSRPSPVEDRASLFVVAAAAAAAWPALVPVADAADYGAAAGPLLAGAGIVIEAVGATIGAAAGGPLVARHGWRSGALPGVLCGIVGAAGLWASRGSAAALPCWAALGFGGGLAASALMASGGRAVGSSRGSSRFDGSAAAGLSGGLAGLALGLLASITLGAEAAMLPGLVVWIAAVAVIASRGNDRAAALRFAVTRPASPTATRRSLAGRLAGSADLRGAAVLAPFVLAFALAQWLLSRSPPILSGSRWMSGGA